MFELIARVFTSSITLKDFDMGIKLSIQKLIKMSKDIEHFAFIYQWKDPGKPGTFIHKCNIVFVTFN